MSSRSRTEVLTCLSEVEELLLDCCGLERLSLHEWDLGRDKEYRALQGELVSKRKKAAALLCGLGFPRLLEITPQMDRLANEAFQARTEFGAHLLEAQLELEVEREKKKAGFRAPGTPLK